MKASKYPLSRLKHVANFGVEVPGTRNPNTGKRSAAGFKTELTLRCGYLSESVTQQYTLAGDTAKTNRVIAIRHNQKASQYKLVQLDGVQYRVMNYASDDDLNAYDLVTLGLTEGFG